MPTWAVVVITAIATWVVVVVIRLFTSREKKIEHALDHLYPASDPQFPLSMAGLLPPAIEGGNSITALVNGDRIFPAMIDAIRSARRTITFETFIYWSGEVGREFADALMERARAGVKVHVLLDWLGADSSSPRGVMALWPASSAFYISGLDVFDAVDRRYWLPGFWTRNGLALLRELLILAPVAVISASAGRRVRSYRPPGAAPPRA